MNTEKAAYLSIFGVVFLFVMLILGGGSLLISEADSGNNMAFAVLVAGGVLVTIFSTGLLIALVLYVNQRQDNQVVQNSRDVQADVLLAARTMAELQRTEQLRIKTQNLQPQLAVTEPEPLYLDTGSAQHIEGVFEDG